ncbi:MAG: hypothetical protein KBA61_14805 [Spirochaetes bacterium]|nr:hypothetical protein [Spirochaetota bacterium]
MKKHLILVALLIAAAPLLSQEGGFQGVADVEFVNEVADKPTATVSDAVGLFAMFYGERTPGFEGNRAFLHEKGVVGRSELNLAGNDGLRRGTLAHMAARYLGLGDSLMYSIIGTGRYAVTVCVANGVMEPAGGEWDVLSGGELVEIVRNVAEKSGGTK